MKYGRDAVRPALVEDLALLHDPEEAADRRAEHDPGSGRVEAVQAGVVFRLDRGGKREQDVAVEPAGLLRADEPGRIEVLHLGRDPDREPARIERLDEVDPALAGDRGAPGRGRVVAERGDRPETRDGDSLHCG